MKKLKLQFHGIEPMNKQQMKKITGGYDGDYCYAILCIDGFNGWCTAFVDESTCRGDVWAACDYYCGGAAWTGAGCNVEC